ncbi:NAD(P)-dependent alcohol dehydrogenase [Acidianus sp. RZ1]|uniref:NAD(P)-dependent alcohol dehydrogenase n=1 Tax=Acidianus sp. RZ1 TaxID=1540082 RepID=UPI0014930298|nr:NAD(P)-dependent alcohol dehydrogenase [Acidianus sp. RZ1]NON61626.1 NAD(P)-dependent alcohol dehydrogenase [Acidianus sp. RZ1]
MKSRAALLTEYGKPLSMGDIEIPDPVGEAVILKVEGAGVCRTDLRIWRGVEARPGSKLPIVLGHENAGRVYAVGDSVIGLKEGDPVIVYATWGDLSCRYCREGRYSLCKNQVIPGQNTNGGFSEYMYVPSYRWLVKLGSLSPKDAAPLADAGTTSMGAVRSAIPYFSKHSDALVLLNGIGGLAIYLIQILKSLFNVTVVGISRKEEHRELARKLGADYAIELKELEDLVKRVRPEGASVAIDLVGTPESVSTLTSALSPGGATVVVGMEGRKVEAINFDLVVWDKAIVGSNYGTINDLNDVVKLTEAGKVRSIITQYSLDDVNSALSSLDSGEVSSRLVITPK